MLPPLQKNEIRILSISPAPSDNRERPQIKCDIQVASLSALPKYETLSYVWGSETATVPILVSGDPFEISRSLYNALQRLQLPDRERLLWIDQICINQQNIEEKAEQVQLMSTIYTKCSRCIAWMGEVKDGVPLADVDAAVQLLHYMATASQESDPYSAPLPSALSAHFGATMETFKGLTPEENQWWQRIWTVQEAALPEYVMLQWGPFQIPWSVLKQARECWCFAMPQPLANLLVQYPGESSSLASFMAHVTWLNLAKLRYDNLFGMIHRYRFRRATDSRDKIYGLLGLSERGLLPVTEKCDYSIPAAQVFSTLTQELIVIEQGLRPLTISPRQRASEATPDIPAWALDLAFSTPVDAPDVYYQMHGYDAYRADEGLDQIDLRAIEAQVGQRTLTLTGVRVDAIVRTRAGYHTNNVANLAQIAAAEALLDEWYAAAVGCPFHLSDDLDGSVSKDMYPGSTYSRAEAFARFILGDVIRNGEQIPEREADHNDVKDIWKIMHGPAEHVAYNTRRTAYGMMINQTMFVTETGLFGCSPLDTEIGDEVWIFRGGNVPFVIRSRKGEDKAYTFVGQCYIQGYMSGEVASHDELTEKTVCLY